MAKKPKNKEIEENEEIEETESEETESEETESDDADEVDESEDDSSGDDSGTSGKKKKAAFFPKEKDLPPSEPKKPKKPKATEFDKIAGKIDEIGAKVDKILNPVKPDKKTDYRLFDEFDPTLGNESEADA